MKCLKGTYCHRFVQLTALFLFLSIARTGGSQSSERMGIVTEDRPVAGTEVFVARTVNPSDDYDVFIDPNVRVSYDGDGLHMEAPIAASATDPGKLYAAAQVRFPGRALFETESHIYTSDDAGATWRSSPLPVVGIGTWDNAMAGGKGRTAYFVTNKEYLTIVRTHDGGATWQATPLNSPFEGWDRPYAVVDNTTGRFSGRLYVVGSLGHSVSVRSSSDGGITFSKAVSACSSASKTDFMSSPSPIVLGDGTLIVPCQPYPASLTEGPIPREFGVVVSSDGGQSFSPYRRIAEPLLDNGPQSIEAISSGALIGPVASMSFAAAPSGTRYSNRIYVVWTVLEKAHERDYRALQLSYSDDEGLTWSNPRHIGDHVLVDRVHVDQAYPMIAVNENGVVAITWYDNRNAMGRIGYDIYLTVSTDGGETFLQETRVTSVTSFLEGSGAVSLAPDLSTWRAGVKNDIMLLQSNYVARTLGADFSQMSVDAAGRFHPLWIDARDGSWQLYTSTIRVVNAALVSHSDQGIGLSGCNLDDKIAFLFGESSWNAKTGQAIISVRLKNKSADAIITSPIQVRLWNDPNDQVTRLKKTDPRLLKAWPYAPIMSQGRKHYGNTANYTFPINARHPLFPNGVTDWVTWRFKIDRPYQMYFSLGRTTRLAMPVCSESTSGNRLISPSATGEDHSHR